MRPKLSSLIFYPVNKSALPADWRSRWDRPWVAGVFEGTPSNQRKGRPTTNKLLLLRVFALINHFVDRKLLTKLIYPLLSRKLMDLQPYTPKYSSYLTSNNERVRLDSLSLPQRKLFDGMYNDSNIYPYQCGRDFLAHWRGELDRLPIESILHPISRDIEKKVDQRVKVRPLSQREWDDSPNLSDLF